MGFLDGKVAVVTGAARGLGTAYARTLATEGADVAICDVKQEVSAVGDEIAATTGRTVRSYPCDVSDAEAVRGFADAVLRDFGGVDIIVLNAAIYGSTPLDLSREEALSQYQRFFDTNVKSVYLCERAFAPSLVERGGGDIVVISTDHVLPPIGPGGTRGGPGSDLYDASKWTLNGYIQAWAAGFAAKNQNVRVNGLGMGATDTPMLRGVFPGGPSDEIVAGWMTAAQQAQLLLDLLQDGRTGDLISSEPGHPVELPPHSALGQPVSNLPIEQFHHGLMGLEPAIWERPS